MRKIYLLFSFLIGLSVSMYSQIPNYVPTDSLLVWYPYSGLVKDESGNNHNGQNFGCVLTENRFGQPNSAYEIRPDTVNGHITTDVAPVDSFTISMWVKPNRTIIMRTESTVCNGSSSITLSNSNQNWVITPAIHGGTSGFGVCMSVGTNGVMVGELATNILTSRMSYTTPINNWTHIAITYRLDSIFLYVNGEIVRKKPTHCPTAHKTLSFSFGGGYNSPECSASIDDVGVWKRALSSNEIKNLYKAEICTISESVTDTLVINTNISGFNPITYNNTIKVYPNPTSDKITIDFGTNYPTLNGYNLKIYSTTNQLIHSNSITQQKTELNLSSFGGTGIYFIHLIDKNGNAVDVKKVILQ